MTNAAPPGPQHPVDLGQPGLAPGPKKYAHRACATSMRASATGSAWAVLADLDVGKPATASLGQLGQTGVRLHADHPRGLGWRSGAGGSRSRSRCRGRSRRPSPGPRRIAALDEAVGVDRAVLQLVGRRVVPDVRARRSAPGRSMPGSDPDGARRGVTAARRRCPAVPFGATHSTSTSAERGQPPAPSHSSTRSGSPAISIRAAARRRARPRRRVRAPAALTHCTKNGSCGSACSPLTPSCRQRSSKPSGRCRLPGTDGPAEPPLDRRDVVDRDHPAEPAAAAGGPRPHRLPERRLVRRPGGRAPRPPRGSGRRSAAAACCGSRSEGEPRRRRTPRRSARPAARRCLPARPDRPRTRRGRGACRALWSAPRSRPGGGRGSAALASAAGSPDAASARCARPGAPRTAATSTCTPASPISSTSSAAVADVDGVRCRCAPRCCPSSTSRGRGRRRPSRAGRTRSMLISV